MANVPARFADETLWPEFEKLDDTLRGYLDEITDRIISESVFADSSEAEVVQESERQLPEE